MNIVRPLLTGVALYSTGYTHTPPLHVVYVIIFIIYLYVCISLYECINSGGGRGIAPLIEVLQVQKLVFEFSGSSPEKIRVD